MPGSQPGPDAQAVADSEGVVFADPVTDLGTYGVPPASPGGLMLAGPRAQLTRRQTIATRSIVPLAPVPGVPGRLVRNADGTLGVTPYSLPGPVAGAAPRPNLDPPQGAQNVIMGQPDGSIVVLPLSTAGYPQADDAGPINQALAQLPEMILPGVSAQPAGIVRLAALPYNVQSTIMVPAQAIVQGQGPGTVIKSSVNGDTFFIQNPVPRGSGIIFQNVLTGMSGGFRDLLIDGTNAGANGCGIHTDSLPERLLIDQVWIQNFTGANAVGLHMSNQVSFTENFKVRVFSANNTLGCLMEKLTGVGLGGSESMRYGDFEMHVVAEQGQSGMAIQGAHFYSGRFVLKGNYAASSSAGPANWAHLYLSPTGIGASPTYAQIQSCEVQLFAEIDLGPLAFNPQTIKFGDLTQNSLTQCYGAMLFQNGFVASNANQQALSFWGMIGGDATMQGVVQQPNQVTQPDFTTAPQAISTPAIPLSGIPLTNNNASAGQTADVMVYIAGGTFTAPVQVNGSNSGDTNARFFYVPSGQTIKLTYSVAPTSWLWVGV